MGINTGDEKVKVILKSWNEWANGNYMEADLMFVKEDIEKLGRLVNEE